MQRLWECSCLLFNIHDTKKKQILNDKSTQTHFYLLVHIPKWPSFHYCLHLLLSKQFCFVNNVIYIYSRNEHKREKHL